VYTDDEPGPGFRKLDPARLAAAQARFRRTADFYWRNSGFRLWLDITLVQIDRDITGPLSIFSSIEGDLAVGGGSTLFGRFVGMSQWSIEDDFVAIHEINHLIDAIYSFNGLRKYEFNHGIWAVPGGVGRDFAINAQILRNMLPANFTAVQSPFTKVLTAPDADGDSVPDASPPGVDRAAEHHRGNLAQQDDSGGYRWRRPERPAGSNGPAVPRHQPNSRGQRPGRKT